MTLDTFFEKFELLADAPDAVARMRELVLNLAVQGKLVRQEPSDEPASEILARLARERPSERRRRTDDIPGSVSRSYVPYEVPNCWAWASFQDVAIIASNLVDPKNHQDCIHVAPDNIEKGTGILLPCATVREDGVKSSNHRFFAGQIVYSKIRPNLAKVVVVDFDGLCSADMYPIDALIDPFFLQRYMLSGPFLAQAVKTDTRVAMPKINQTELNAIAVPVPPLAEQKRIVAKVEELMALCDRLEAQQQERATRHAALARASLARFAEAPTPAHLNLLFHPSCDIPPAELRKAILTLAVKGKLVEQDASEGSANELVAKLQNERQLFAEEHKFRSPMPLSMDESAVPFDIPSTWKWCRLSSLFNAVTDGDHLPPPKSQDGVAFLTIGNITTGKVDFGGCRFVPEAYYRALAGFRRPVRGDILYTVVGATYGRPALVDAEREFCVQRHIAVLKPSPSIDVGYLMILLRSPLTYEQATASTTGTAQPTIPLGSLRNFATPLPPLAEQRRIVAKVEQLMTLVDRLEARLAASRESAGKLLQAAVIELTC